jgi:hypothetical protein
MYCCSLLPRFYKALINFCERYLIFC